MSVRTALIVVLALVFGGAAAVLARNFIQPADPVFIKPETVQVVVALMGIERGSKLVKEQVLLKEIPKDFVPPDAITRIEDALDRIPLGTLYPNEILVSSKLSQPGALQGLAPLIREGMRAFSISLPSFASSVAGFIQPGHRVDVLLTQNTSHGGSTTSTLLQYVEVLAVHQRVEATATGRSPEGEAGTVALLVTPDDANFLELAQTKGQLKLVLRNPKDKEQGMHRVYTEDMLRPHVEVLPPPAVENPLPAPVLVDPVKNTVVSPPKEEAKPKPNPIIWTIIVREGDKMKKHNYHEREEDTAPPEEKPK